MNAADLWAMLATEDGTSFEFWFRPDPDWYFGEPTWGGISCDVADERAFASYCAEGDCSVSLIPRHPGAPAEPGWRDLGRSSVLWCRVDSGASVQRLERFKPQPTIVVREGSSVRHLALWWLATSISAEHVEQANRRLAHALGVVSKKWCRPGFMAHPPGTVLMSVGKRPAVVHASHVSTDRFTARDVVGHLRDAPVRRLEAVA